MRFAPSNHSLFGLLSIIACCHQKPVNKLLLKESTCTSQRPNSFGGLRSVRRGRALAQ